jgi:hypothetical protein
MVVAVVVALITEAPDFLMLVRAAEVQEGGKEVEVVFLELLVRETHLTLHRHRVIMGAMRLPQRRVAVLAVVEVVELEPLE